jgi:hypothetical protein
MDIAALLHQIDRDFVLYLNSFVGDHYLGNKIIDAIAQNAFVRGFPVFFPLVAIWFVGENQKRRARMFAGMLASFIAVVISIAVQHRVLVHTRPFLDDALQLKLYDP